MASPSTTQSGNSATAPTTEGNCNFLKAVLTPQALGACNASPNALVIVLLALFAMISTVGIAVWIHFGTRKEEQRKNGTTRRVVKRMQALRLKKTFSF